MEKQILNANHELVTTEGIIDMVNVSELPGTMDRINKFQVIVQKNLKEGMDYGVIPNCGKKPTLLKPGAEKILMLLGIRSEFDIIEQTRDFEKGFFDYQIKCKLFKADILITEGMGTCNTKESKYRKSDAFSIDNTVLKMAKKRALVDAALMVGSLSGIFTQDLEDVGDNLFDNKKPTANPKLITKDQRLQMFADANNPGLVKEIMAKYHYIKSTEIKLADYDKICIEIQERIETDMPEVFQ
jgi:hypothetical protein